VALRDPSPASPTLLALQFDEVLNMDKVHFTHDAVKNFDPDHLVRSPFNFSSVTLPTVWPRYVPARGRVTLLIVNTPAQGAPFYNV
jgi:hypothetical protein